MENKFFLHQIKHNKTAGTFDKGIVVKDTYEAAKQGYHAYLGAYAYGQSTDTDYVSCSITGISSARPLMEETWMEPQPKPEPEPKPSPDPEPEA